MQRKNLTRFKLIHDKKKIKKIRYGGNYLNIVKAICSQTHRNFMFNKEKTLPLRSGTIQECLLSLLFLYIILDVLDTKIGKYKKPNYPNLQMISYYAQKSIKTEEILLETISIYSKIADYKTNAYTAVVFLYVKSNIEKKLKIYSKLTV